MREHPDRETLQQFISGQLGSEDARLTDRHLSVCSECRDRADEISTQLAFQLLDSWLRPSYDEAFERAADRAADRLAAIWEEGQNTKGLLADLLREPYGRRCRIKNEERFQNLKLCQILQSRSRDLWSSDPYTAREMADLAVDVARYLNTAKYGSSLVEDARALSWAHLGNSFRVTADLWRSEQALLQAWRHHVSGDGDAYTEAELLSFTSSLRLAQDNHKEAIRLADKAVSLYREGQDSRFEGSTLLLKGQILGFYGRCQEAVSVTRAGLACIDSIQDPRLSMAGTHNLICNLALSGALTESWNLLQKSRSLYQDLGRMDFARLRWLDADFARHLGNLAEAESALCETREFFLEHQIGTDVIFVSLDLAELYMRQGRLRQVREVLAGVIPLSDALGLQEKSLAARLLYGQALKA